MNYSCLVEYDTLAVEYGKGNFDYRKHGKVNFTDITHVIFFCCDAEFISSFELGDTVKSIRFVGCDLNFETKYKFDKISVNIIAVSQLNNLEYQELSFIKLIVDGPVLNLTGRVFIGSGTDCEPFCDGPILIKGDSIDLYSPATENAIFDVNVLYTEHVVNIINSEKTALITKKINGFNWIKSRFYSIDTSGDFNTLSHLSRWTDHIIIKLRHENLLSSRCLSGPVGLQRLTLREPSQAIINLVCEKLHDLQTIDIIGHPSNLTLPPNHRITSSNFFSEIWDNNGPHVQLISDLTNIVRQY